MDINVVVLIGRLTRDAELKYTQSGKAVASFLLAVNRRVGDKDIASFFNCVAWEKTGELIAQYTKKGDPIAVEGRLQQRTWDDKDGNKRQAVEVVATNVKFLSPKKHDSTMDQEASAPSDDDITF